MRCRSNIIIILEKQRPLRTVTQYTLVLISFINPMHAWKDVCENISLYFDITTLLQTKVTIYLFRIYFRFLPIRPLTLFPLQVKSFKVEPKTRFDHDVAGFNLITGLTMNQSCNQIKFLFFFCKKAKLNFNTIKLNKSLKYTLFEMIWRERNDRNHLKKPRQA